MTCLRIVEASITITDQGAFQEYNHLAAAFSYSLQLSIPRPPPPFLSASSYNDGYWFTFDLDWNRAPLEPADLGWVLISFIQLERITLLQILTTTNIILS